ncbi:MAG TPA: hypothetical protein VHR39_09990 [Propionibacteriaceae bacterium]|jgi:hypothetical protein|nr:hypothetical protein [Propionibacteriaceae bacterium]
MHVNDHSIPVYVQRLIESQPPSLAWSRSSGPQPNQPPLNLTERDHAEAAAPDD